ncbi:MBL fold metallo-hydrolase [Paenactinomyces guangxiensis]|uniref:MBL fold metallo-hydrolase n=1 Tax=Paenactinomyces guangxiensis TaxID=1490290 RepID=A0A7W1WR96_9BACL|nr:MBL fold metallo-hydrolase [Paenactinomyces guangxiensis]MBA4494426.1 MBL fold metallo-hydrolase [Paenactinomyces guangxiensis]MBH8591519.1 MBL fold metallo-hydrolase [Paenactinomyces guangxiensis]
MRFTVLGCHSPFPGPGGATPGYLLEAGGKRILIDCGSGVLAQLGKMISPWDLDGVILSHLHHDHISDFFVLQYAIMTAMKLKKRTSPLPVWAPEKPGHWYSKLSFGNYIEKHIIKEGLTVDVGDLLNIRFYRTDHGIPCYAMNITDGTHSILYGADSGVNTNWELMTDSPDLFICEATYLDQDLPPGPTGHLSAKQAARAANRIQTKQLLLTHFFPGYEPEQIQQEAETVFAGKCRIAASGLQIDL